MSAHHGAIHAVRGRGPERPDDRARTGLVQPFLDGGRFSKARRAALSFCTVSRFGGGSGSASRRRCRTRRASVPPFFASSSAIGGKPANPSRSAIYLNYTDVHIQDEFERKW
jgi:hypothetical protein